MFRSRRTTKNVYNWPPIFFGRDDLDVLRQFVSAIYLLPFGEV